MCVCVHSVTKNNRTVQLIKLVDGPFSSQVYEISCNKRRFEMRMHSLHCNLQQTKSCPSENRFESNDRY